MCQPRLRHHVRRVLRGFLQVAHACLRLVSATMCGERCALLRASMHVSAPPPPLCTESAVPVTRKCPPCLRHHVLRRLRASAWRHTQVSSSSPPPYAESVARIYWLHTPVSASSPPSHVESAARFHGWHTHVSAPPLLLCAESAARICEQNTQVSA